MALDKLVDSTQLDADLTSVANAIRTKGGTSGSLAFPAGFVSAVEAIETGGGSGGYDINGGDITALFDQYAQENNMTVMDVTFASDQTANVTVQHSLGRVPVEMLLYPKTNSNNGGGYQIGWVAEGMWGVDKNGNRTARYYIQHAPASISKVWYPDAKNLASLLLSSITKTNYNFTQSQPTATTVTLRGGTSADVKLLAGEYRIALR